MSNDHIISDESSLRALYKETHPLAVKKCLPGLDMHCREFISRSPFLCLSTQGGEGKADVSPRGDPAGFVQVLDDNTLVIPDRPGNNRLDSLSNIIANASVGLLFLVPGFEETLRVNGKARLSTEPELLSTMTVKNRTPTLAIVISIDEVFLHCAKALRRSDLWDASAHQNRKEMPSLAHMVLDQTTGLPADENEMKTVEAGLEEEYKNTMY